MKLYYNFNELILYFGYAPYFISKDRKPILIFKLFYAS